MKNSCTCANAILEYVSVLLVGLCLTCFWRGATVVGLFTCLPFRHKSSHRKKA